MTYCERLPYVVILNEVKNLEVSVAVVGSASLEILRCTQDDIEPTMARRCFDFAQHDIVSEPTYPHPLNHIVTMSQCHSVTRGGGSVISVTRCDKVGHKWDKEIKEVKEIKEIKDDALTSLNTLNSLISLNSLNSP